jgi:hypothetical protein
MLPIILAALALPEPTGAAPPAPPPPACAAAEYHQFDVWIGRWDVTDAKTGAPAGHSLVESLYGGCVLRENWSEPGWQGGSLNIYAKPDGAWRQTWMDQSGALRDFSGGLKDGRMVLVAHTRSAAGRPILVRMTFTPNPDGTVRQYSDYSADDGATWKQRYDYLYRRAAGSAQATQSAGGSD